MENGDSLVFYATVAQVLPILFLAALASRIWAQPLKLPPTATKRQRQIASFIVRTWPWTRAALVFNLVWGELLVLLVLWRGEATAADDRLIWANLISGGFLLVLSYAVDDR